MYVTLLYRSLLTIRGVGMVRSSHTNPVLIENFRYMIEINYRFVLNFIRWILFTVKLAGNFKYNLIVRMYVGMYVCKKKKKTIFTT